MEDLNVKFGTNVTKYKKGRRKERKRKLTVAIAGGDSSSATRTCRTSIVLTRND